MTKDVFTEAEREQACHLEGCIRHGHGTVGCPIRALERTLAARASRHGVDLEVVLGTE